MLGSCDRLQLRIEMFVCYQTGCPACGVGSAVRSRQAYTVGQNTSHIANYLTVAFVSQYARSSRAQMISFPNIRVYKCLGSQMFEFCDRLQIRIKMLLCYQIGCPAYGVFLNTLPRLTAIQHSIYFQLSYQTRLRKKTHKRLCLTQHLLAQTLSCFCMAKRSFLVVQHVQYFPHFA